MQIDHSTVVNRMHPWATWLYNMGGEVGCSTWQVLMVLNRKCLPFYDVAPCRCSAALASEFCTHIRP
jgi:hypothetical protein